MTHTPPIPNANQAPYPPAGSSSTPTPEKAALIAQMKSNSAKQRKSGSATPVALLAGAALVGAIGYVIWTGRADPGSQK